MSDEEQKRAKRERELDRRRREADADLVTVMEAAQGRRFVWRLIESMAGAMDPSYAGDALPTAYNEGRRAVGLALMVEVQRVAPERFVQMMGEEMTARRQAEGDPPDPTT